MSRVLLALVVGLSPTAAAAAGDDGGHFFWEAFNLVLLIAVLVFVARKPVLNYMAERRDGIEQNLAASEKLLSEAKGRLAEWNAKAAQLDAEVESIKDQARKSAEFEAEQILADARVAAERIEASARAVVDRELNHAQERLRAESASLAVEMASQVLTQSVTSDDRSRLVDEFIAKVEADGSTGGAH